MLARHRHAFLEVLSPDVRAFPAGSRLVLSRATRVLIGRDTACTLAVQDDAVGRRHCAVEWRPGEGWELQDLGTTNGTLLNGAQVDRRVLGPGDTVTIGRTSLRFLEEVSTLEFSEALEAAILDAPEDEGRWLVYADWLQERQNPYGAAMVRRAPQDALLEGLTEWVQAAWRFGMVSRAVVRQQGDRGTSGRAPSPAGLVRELLEAPPCRLLQALELDLRSFDPEETDLVGAAAESMRAVTEHRPAGLRTLRIGPLGAGLTDPGVWAAFEGVAAACPRFATRWEELFLVPARAWLEVAEVSAADCGLVKSQRVALDPGQPWRLRRDSSSVHLQAVGPWRVQLLRELPGVTRFPVPGFAQGGPLELAVNGRPCDASFLRNGDELSLSPVARLVFREE